MLIWNAKPIVIMLILSKIDRCSTDLQRILGVIHSVSGGDQVKYYKVATSVGMIKKNSGVVISILSQAPLHQILIRNYQSKKQHYKQMQPTNSQ